MNDDQIKETLKKHLKERIENDYNSLIKDKALIENWAKKQFPIVVIEFLFHFEVESKDLAHKIGCTASTIERWKKGLACPHHLMIPPALKVFLQMIEEKECQKKI